MFNLWDYQEEAVSRVTDFFSHGGRATILQLPTGTGKSLIASTFIQRMKSQSKPVYFVTSSSSLLWQFSEHMDELGLRHGVIKSGCPTLRYHVQVVSVQSLMNRIHMIDEPYAVIFEEAHHTASNQFMKVLEAWPNALILGLTATPRRPDGKPLTMYENIISINQVQWFIDNYYLSDFDYYIPAELDTAGLHRQFGDFKSGELSERVRADKTRISGLVKWYQKYADGKPGIAFGTSIADSEEIASRFCEAGYNMIPLHSKIDGSVKDILSDARQGKISLISSCDLIGEGVSVNGLTVELDGRPTESLVIKLQHSGRVLRAHYAKGHDLSTKEGRRAAMIEGGKGKAQILDFSSNYLRHGLPSDDREWTLESAGKIKQPSKYKRCPSCQRPIPVFAQVCPHCAYVFPAPIVMDDPTPERDGELIPISELKFEDKSRLQVKIGREAKSMRDAVRIAKAHGANHQAAWYIWRVLLRNKA